MSERARLWLIVAVAMMLLPAHAVAADEQKQVLVVYSTRRDTQVAIVGDRELPRVLEAGLSRKLDYYSEYIDGARFPDPEYRTAFHDYIKLKYRGTQFDLVVAVQDAALDFVTKYRQDLFAETPVVFEASRRAADAAPDATGIVTEFDLRQTLTLATALQPETAEVFVVTGASARDKAY